MRRSRPAAAPLLALAVGLAAASVATACASSDKSGSKFDSVASAIDGGPVGGAPTTGGLTTTTVPNPTVAPATGSGPAITGADAPAEALCALLTDEDFADVGVAGTTAPTVNSDQPGSAYCVYAGRSAAAGGVELDVFVSADAAEAATTYQTARGEYPATSPTRPDLPGIDEGELDAGGPDRAATIIVRKGNLVLTLGFPSSGAAEDQLLELTRTALERAGA